MFGMHIAFQLKQRYSVLAIKCPHIYACIGSVRQPRILCFFVYVKIRSTSQNSKPGIARCSSKQWVMLRDVVHGTGHRASLQCGCIIRRIDLISPNHACIFKHCSSIMHKNPVLPFHQPVRLWIVNVDAVFNIYLYSKYFLYRRIQLCFYYALFTLIALFCPTHYKKSLLCIDTSSHLWVLSLLTYRCTVRGKVTKGCLPQNFHWLNGPDTSVCRVVRVRFQNFAAPDYRIAFVCKQALKLTFLILYKPSYHMPNFWAFGLLHRFLHVPFFYTIFHVRTLHYLRAEPFEKYILHHVWHFVIYLHTKYWQRKDRHSFFGDISVRVVVSFHKNQTGNCFLSGIGNPIIVKP